MCSYIANLSTTIIIFIVYIEVVNVMLLTLSIIQVCMPIVQKCHPIMHKFFLPELQLCVRSYLESMTLQITKADFKYRGGYEKD